MLIISPTQAHKQEEAHMCAVYLGCTAVLWLTAVGTIVVISCSDPSCQAYLISRWSYIWQIKRLRFTKGVEKGKVLHSDLLSLPHFGLVPARLQDDNPPALTDESHTEWNFLISSSILLFCPHSIFIFHRGAGGREKERPE